MKYAYGNLTRVVILLLTRKKKKKEEEKKNEDIPLFFFFLSIDLEFEHEKCTLLPAFEIRNLHLNHNM